MSSLIRQIQFDSFGPPSLVARCVNVADVGIPSAWEVVVDVAAFPINVADLAMLAGRYGTLPKLPSTIGMEAAGTVTAVGSSVKEITSGDRVVLLGNQNWAERRKLPVSAVHKIPADSDLMQMSMLKVNPTTAHLLLSEFVKLETGDWIIQNAPLSSVGQCIIQLAKIKGLRTINVVRPANSQTVDQSVTPPGRTTNQATAQVLALGGTAVVEDGLDLAQRVRALLRHDPLKLALDAVAGPNVQRLAECLNEGGQIVNYGMLSNEPCSISPEQTIFRGISLQGFWLSKLLNRFSLNERRTVFDTLAQLMATGQLKLQVDSCFTLSDIGAALQRAEQSGRSGKVIVECRK